MWCDPYLETCCRAALHRVLLAGATGRPVGLPGRLPGGLPGGLPGALKDAPCLDRLAMMGLVAAQDDQRYRATPAGVARHRHEILHQTLACTDPST
jgi:hypothetical protein